MEEMIPGEWYADNISRVRSAIFSGCFFGVFMTAFSLFRSRHYADLNLKIWIPLLGGIIAGMVFGVLSFWQSNYITRKTALDSAYDDALSPTPDQHSYRYRLTCLLKHGRARVPGGIYLRSDDVVFVPNNIVGTRVEPIHFGNAQRIELSLSRLPISTAVQWLTGQNVGPFLQVGAESSERASFIVPEPAKTIELLRSALLELSLNLQHPPRQ
jgi:hypothetical protein